MSRPVVNFNTTGNAYSIPTQQGNRFTDFRGNNSPVPNFTIKQNPQQQLGQNYRSELYGADGAELRNVPTGAADNYGYGSGYANTQMRAEQPINQTGANFTSGITGPQYAEGYRTSQVEPVRTNPRPVNFQSSNMQPMVQQSPETRQEVKITSQAIREPMRATQQTYLIEQECNRPKYAKLYTNSAEYYRNVGADEDPSFKKTCCSPICWVLWGLLGLLVLLFGILCGLGVICNRDHTLIGNESFDASEINQEVNFIDPHPIDHIPVVTNPNTTTTTNTQQSTDENTKTGYSLSQDDLKTNEKGETYFEPGDLVPAHH